MAKIKYNLENKEFKVCPEGERELTITKAECTPSGKPSCLKITFQDKEGAYLNSRYDFNNSKALFAMGMLCKTVLDMGDEDEFDTTEDTKRLMGKVVLAEVVHSQGTNEREDGTYPTFANVKKIISLVNKEAEIANAIDDLMGDVSPRNIIADDL